MPTARLVCGIKLAQYSKGIVFTDLISVYDGHGVIGSTYTKHRGMCILLPTFCMK